MTSKQFSKCPTNLTITIFQPVKCSIMPVGGKNAQHPSNRKSRTISTRLTDTALSFPITPVVLHPASPGNFLNKSKYI
jgi:hypothetical protein